MSEPFDLAIIGGGPAGQAAALALGSTGLSIVMLDEQLRPGGQIHRQPPRQFAEPGSSKNGALERFEALPLDWRGGRSVLGIGRADGGFLLHAEQGETVKRIVARRVLVAAGCQDVAAPLPGWTLPGVMAAGGIQAFVKSQRLMPGNRITLAGTHPLMLLIADQIVAAGGSVAAVSFAQPLSVLLRAVLTRPGAVLAGSGNLFETAGIIRRLRRAGTPVRFGVGPKRIKGEYRVEALELADRTEICCDAVGLCFGFVPQADLVRMAGAEVRRCAGAGGWAAVADTWMESSIPGLFVAGETTRVAGAPAAAVGGAIAGLGIARAAGSIAHAEADRRAAPLRRRHARLLAFADLLDAAADPSRYWPIPDPETIACRCEDVSFADLHAALGAAGTANAVKLLTRCGMGVCQGRNCEGALLRLLDAHGNGGDPGFAARFPVRPVRIGALAQ